MDFGKNTDAQFMLLAGFIIGTGLVITTVMLNSLLFEGNMAVEAGNELSKDEIANLIMITQDEIRKAYKNSTDPGQNVSLKFNNFSNQMQNFSSNLSKIYAMYGESINVSWDIERWKSNQYANFTENGMAGGRPDWSVVEGVNASSVSIFRFTNTTFSITGFRIEARNSSNYTVWSVEFNSSGYKITNTTGTSYGNVSGQSIDLNSTSYYFKQSIPPGPVSLYFINGNNAYGKFQIQGTANGRTFYRERHFIINSTLSYYTSRLRANFTIPFSVPW